MMTSTGVNNVDQYLETIVHEHGKLLYRDGTRLLTLGQREITVPYRRSDGSMGSRTFTTYYTNNGPVVGRQGDQWISTRLMERTRRRMEQSWLRMKATDLASFQKADALQANSSNDTVFADDRGEIAFLMPQFIAKRDRRFDFTKPVAGSNPATAWQGATPLDAMPNVINPPGGWVVNTNNAPWYDAGSNSPKRANYPAYMDTFGQNPRGVHALRLLEGARDFTVGTLINDAYDSYMPPFAKLVPILVSDYDALPPNDPLRRRLAGPISVLRTWNDRWGVTSIPTTLAVLWGDRMWAVIGAGKWDEFMSDYQRIGSPGIGSARRLQALAAVVDRLEKDFGTWAVPWGAINRYQRLSDDLAPHFDDAKPSIPIPFASSRWGSLASYQSHYWPGTNKYYGNLGNSFVAVVEFGPKVQAWAIKVGGESGHPDSPHFTDQAKRYALGNLRPVYFWPDELKGHVEREYHPGH